MKARGYTKETITEVGTRKLSFPKFNVGDTIAVYQRIKEGDKERVQVFEGDVLAIRNNGASSAFIVRKIGAHGVAVERIIPFYSPLLKEIKVIRHAKVRRAKLYYVRNRVGRTAKFKEDRVSKGKAVSNESVEMNAVHTLANGSGHTDVMSK